MSTPSTPVQEPPPLSPSPTILAALERRMSHLSITVATDRADAREKLPSKRGVVAKDNKCTLISESIQGAIEKGWIDLQGASVETKQDFLEKLEKGYAELVEGWRKEGWM